MRVGLPHLGQFVDLVVSISFLRSAVFAIFAMWIVLGSASLLERGGLKMIAGVPISSSLHDSRESVAVLTLPGYAGLSSCSAISSSFVTVFQFRPVPEIPKAFSIRAMGSCDFPTPLR